jgi:N-acyl-D-amino-acid deacylase
VTYKNFFFLVALVLAGRAMAQHPAQEALDGAISRATEILNKGVTNYPEHRSCFSCHHQALPLLANSVGNVQRAEARRSFYDRQLTRDVAAFTEHSFSTKRKSLMAGGEIGGKALTVAYGLWALDLSGAQESETTQAMVEYLLKTQADDGAWNFQSLRPPAASSRAMTSAVAVYGLRSYAHGVVDKERIQAVYQRALAWSQQLGEPASHEDLIGQVWLEYMLHNELGMDEFRREQDLQDKLWKSQRADGGWAQTAELSSDAYATGQALTMLAEVFYVTKKPLHSSDKYERGIKFLLDTQQSDGSWRVKTRSKPVQVFFDNGDPHGEHQFISMMATSWATAALREYTHTTYNPLESPRVAARLTNQRQP